MADKKELVFFITHSLGELDIILPMICKINSDEYGFRVIFLVESIFEKFEKNPFYKLVFKLLCVEYDKIKMPNKFDRKKISLGLNFFYGKLSIFFINPVSVLRFYILIGRSSLIFHEHSCQIDTIRVIYVISRMLKKYIFTYVHGHACLIDTKLKKIQYCTKRAHFLNFHKHSYSVYFNAGYKKQSIIGYPKFYKEWKNFISTNFSKNPFNREFVLIFTRPISPYYMDRKVYTDLLIESFSSIVESFGGDMLVVIKPHPREDVDYINQLLINSKVNFVISQIDSSVLAFNARAAISFWTSAILSSLAFKVPSVEFYKEATNFRKIEPKGSVYKKLGLPSVDNKQDLVKFLEKVASNKMKIPSKILDDFGEKPKVDINNILSQFS